MIHGYYDESRARSYDLEHAGNDITTDDIPFYLDLARECHARGLPVLELGAGTGRVTLPIAREGIGIVGLDNAAAMLKVARTKSEAEHLGNVRWLQADMADFELDQRFGLAIIPFRSFLLLTTVAQQLSCLRCIYDHLVAGGRLALNFFNPDLSIIASWSGERKGLWEHDRPSPHQERWASRRYDTAKQQMQQDDVVHELTDDAAIISRVERSLRLRYVFRYEMEHLLSLAGFTVDSLHGWFDRRDFTAESSEMVWTASKHVAADSIT